MPRELTRDAIEYGDDFEFVTGCKTRDIVAIELNDSALRSVDGRKSALFNIDGYRLRHAAYKHVFAHKGERSAM